MSISSPSSTSSQVTNPMADLTALLKPGSDDDWETPQWLFDLLDEEFGFVADLAATPGNAKHERYLSPATDAFQQDWRRFLHAGEVPYERAGADLGLAPCSGWLNPPYGRDVSRWVYKATLTGDPRTRVVCLLPARTDTTWWHKYVRLASEVRLLKGRLRFSNAEQGAPFPSAIVIFGGAPTASGEPVFRFVDYRHPLTGQR